MTHFEHGFAAVAGEMVVLNSGEALNLDFKSIPYRHKPRDFWPVVQGTATGHTQS